MLLKIKKISQSRKKLATQLKFQEFVIFRHKLTYLYYRISMQNFQPNRKFEKPLFSIEVWLGIPQIEVDKWNLKILLCVYG